MVFSPRKKKSAEGADVKGPNTNGVQVGRKRPSGRFGGDTKGHKTRRGA